MRLPQYTECLYSGRHGMAVAQQALYCDVRDQLNAYDESHGDLI